MGTKEHVLPSTAHEAGRSHHRRKKSAKEKLTRQKTVFQKLLESEHHMTMVFSYCGVFLLYGMADELLGPTLIELSCLAAKPIKTMSWLFFSHDVGLLCGTLFGGLVVSRVDKNLAMTICLISNALSITILPTLHKFMGMVLFVFLYGFFLGTPDTLANVMLIKVFGKEVAPYLQGVHFFYGFGAFLSPLVARPFLRTSCSYLVNTTRYYDVQDPQYNLTFDKSTGLWSSTQTEILKDRDSDVMYAYWMTALFHVPVIFGLSWIFLKRHLDSKKGIYRGSFVSLHNDDELPVQSLDVLPYNPEASFWERVQNNAHHRLLAVTILCSIIMYLYEGLMAMFGGYIYSFAVKSAKVSMTSDQGAYLASMYWGFFSLGRFLSIIFAFFASPKSMLMTNVVGCLISSVVFAAGQSNLKAIYVGTCLLGLSLSSTAPSIIAMAELYVDLTAHTTSILIISSALGELTMPLMVGQVFEKIGTSIVPGTVLFICFLGFIGYCLLLTFDNDKAYEHASAMWKIFRNFVCFGCESEKSKIAKQYTCLETSSDYASSSDVSEEMNNCDIIKRDQIPKPDMFTNRVQPPPDIEVIDESLIVAEIVYGCPADDDSPEKETKSDGDVWNIN